MDIKVNNHQSLEGHHQQSFLGESHPHKVLQHGHYEKVFDKDCKEWMVEWINWLLELSYDNSPMVYQQVNPYKKDYNNLRRSKEDKEKGILFLAASVYGSSGNTYSSSYEIVPIGEWHIFFAPYMIFNSKLEYPSLEEDELFSLAERQVNSVYKLEVLLDGISIECCRVPIKPEDNAIIRNIPDNNILGIDPEEIETDNSTKVVGDGYGCFLNPLDPGLHILSFRGISPTYSLETQIQLNVRGPRQRAKA